MKVGGHDGMAWGVSKMFHLLKEYLFNTSTLADTNIVSGYNDYNAYIWLCIRVQVKHCCVLVVAE